MTNSIFLTRAEYDRTIVNGSDAMTRDYISCERKWSTGGVRVTGDEEVVTRIHFVRVASNRVRRWLIKDKALKGDSQKW